MRFFDQVRIAVKSGHGGDGLVAARRESGIPFGGPAGWNGGRWWNVFFVWSKDMNTLVDFRQNKIYKANSGEPGRTKDQYGADAEDIVLKVPLGTVIKDGKTGKALVQFLEDGQEYIAAKWGRWGVGNMHFKNSINQYPNFALLWEPGQKKDLLLELQLLGDIWLIGTPSVGKSTLINAVSNVKAKTAAYHFTTLVPNLGSIKVDGYSFNMVDIPGLIKGASQGKWLGNEFLKHVLKSQIFALVVDVSRYEQWFSELTDILDEIMIYMKKRFSDSSELGIEISDVSLVLRVTPSKHIILDVLGTTNDEEKILLFQKVLHIVVSKYDLLNDEEMIAEYLDALHGHIASYFEKNFSFSLSKEQFTRSTFVLSAANRYWLDKWLHYLADLLQHEEVKHMSLIEHETIVHEEAEVIKDVTDKEKAQLVEQWYIDEKASKYARIWEVSHPEVSRLSFMVQWGNDEAMMWYWKIMDREGFVKIYDRAGVVPGDILLIKSYYEWLSDRYIMYGM